MLFVDLADYYAAFLLYFLGMTMTTLILLPLILCPPKRKYCAVLHPTSREMSLARWFICLLGGMHIETSTSGKQHCNIAINAGSVVLRQVQ